MHGMALLVRQTHVHCCVTWACRSTFNGPAAPETHCPSMLIPKSMPPVHPAVGPARWEKGLSADEACPGYSST